MTTLAEMVKTVADPATPGTMGLQQLRAIRALAPFSQQEMAHLQFVRWLYQTGRISG